jgi:3-polyprenyl-4-hydroxybenzoate decarboxylase
MWANLTAAEGVHLIAPTAQDTLDFTGPAMNEGSRLILIATRGPRGPVRGQPPADRPEGEAVHSHVAGLARLGPAVLMAQVTDAADRSAVMQALAQHPVTREYLFHVLVSADVPLDDPRLMLWGWFTRFDPLADLHPARRRLEGNRVVLEFPIAIDATWKPGYRKPVALDPDREREVDGRWGEYGI